MKIIIIILLFTVALQSQNKISYDEIGHNNFGKEFYLTVPPNLSQENLSHKEFVNFLFFSPFDANVSLEIPGKGFKTNLSVKANKTSGIKLNINTVQPIIKNGNEDIHYDLVFKNSAIIIKSDYPISVIVLSNFENSADSYLAIPLENLGKNYVVSNYQDVSDRYSGYLTLKSNSTIIATEDNTNVEFFYPAENTPYDVRGPKISGNTFTKTLNKGDIWVMSSYQAKDDLSNARVKSNKPISVISSNQCANIPANNNWCDFIMNMELPVEFWGKSYIISKYSYKRYSPLIRVFAAESNTQIFLNGTLYDEIDDVFSEIKKSYIEIQRPLDNNFKPFIISSDKPIMVTSYNTGDEEDQKEYPNGGPSMMSLPSIQSMTNFISISSPNFSEDISFNDNYVNLLFELDESNDIPESFEYGFLIGNEFKWNKIKNNQNIISTQKINVPYNNKIYGVINFRLPTTGQIKFRSNYKFTAINYGTKEFKSYGFSSNYNLVLNQGVDTTAPKIDWSSTCDSQIIGAITEDNLKGNLLIPDSNLTNMRVIDRSKNPANFVIDIIDKTKGASGTIRVWDAYGNITNQKVYYKPQDVAIEPTRIKLNTKSNQRVTENFSIINNSDEDFELKKLYSDFESLEFYFNGIDIQDLTIIIPPKSEYQFQVSLNSPVDTIFNAKLFIANDCLDRQLARINIDVTSPIIEVTDVDFQDIITGQELIKEFKIYNRGKVTLEITGVIYPNIYDFEIIGMPLISEINPFKIAPNSFFTGYIKNKSQKKGLLYDSLKFRSDAERFDSVCYISANLLEPGFIVNSYDFERKIISTDNNNIQPYKSNTMMIANYSKVPIRIKDLKFFGEQNSSAFIINKDYFINKLLQPNEEYEFIVEFKPQTLGQHNLNIEFILFNDIPTYSVLSLKGFGTLPKLEFKDTLDFGKIQLNSTKNEKFEIHNIVKNWEYHDKLEKYNLEYDYSKAEEYGFNLFDINYREINPNANVENNFSFTPNKIGIEILEVKIHGNFEGNNTFYLKGEGVDSKLQIITPDLNAYACENEKDTISITFHNIGTSEINLEPLYFSPIIPEFSFVESKYSLSEFTIQPNEIISIPIEFTSFGKDRNTQLIIKEKQKITTTNINFNGINRLYDNEFELKPISQKVEVNKPALTTVSIENSPELKDANIQDLSLLVTFDPSMLKLQNNSIRLSNKHNSKYIIDNFTELENGKVRFDLISLTEENLSDGGELVSFIFNTFLPNEIENKSKVNIDIIAKTTQCVNFKTNNQQEIEMILECGDEFRKVNSDLIPFHIDKINPNPLDRNLDLSYSIPFDSNVYISLVNIKGDIVRVFENSYKAKGFYNFNLNIENIASGQYFLRINAGQFSDNISLIIKK